MEAGLEYAVAFATPYGPTNIHLMDNHSDNQIFFYWVTPFNYNELESFDATRIKGLKFHPSHNKTPITEKELIPFIIWAEQNHCPFIIHAGRWQEMSGYSKILEVAENYSCNFIIAHMGGITQKLKDQTSIDIAKKGLDNVFIETSSCLPLPNDFKNETGCSKALFQKIVNRLGAEHILFGSDFPFFEITESMKFVIDATDEYKILGENLADILK